MAMVTWGMESKVSSSFFFYIPLLCFAHGAFGLNGNVVRFASTPNEKICHWGVFVGRHEKVTC